MSEPLADWPDELPAPLAAGHRLATAAGHARTRMESGRVRVRRVMEPLRELADATWLFTRQQFSAFKAFYEDVLDYGTARFRAAFYDANERREMRFWDAAYALEYDGDYARVRAALELFPAQPVPVDVTFTMTEGGGVLRDTGGLVTFAVTLDGAPLPQRES